MPLEGEDDGISLPVSFNRIGALLDWFWESVHYDPNPSREPQLVGTPYFPMSTTAEEEDVHEGYNQETNEEGEEQLDFGTWREAVHHDDKLPFMDAQRLRVHSLKIIMINDNYDVDNREFKPIKEFWTLYPRL